MRTSLAEQDKAFLADFTVQSQFGRTPGGGVERQAASRADGELRRWFAEWLIAREFRIEYDQIGNQYGLLEYVPGRPYILVGSHMDSQPMAGRFDGAYGVLAAAHAADRLRRRWAREGITPNFNLGVVNWFNEEGSRFKPSMMGSSVYTGLMSAKDAMATLDKTGTSVAAALANIDCLGAGPGPKAAAYAEIHIEQGRILEDEGTTLGVVESTWATQKFELKVTGAQSHTGATIMADRRDAMYGGALLVVAARDIADEVNSRPGSAPLHTSVSELTVEPNSPVTIAREVQLHVDFRSPDEEVLDLAVRRFHQLKEEAAAKARVTIQLIRSHGWGLLPYAAEGQKLAASVADELGISWRRMMTVAGHDSTNMKDVVPTVMLFVPSIDGVSHNEAEDTHPEDACAGVDVLTDVLRRMCETTWVADLTQ